MGGRRSFNSFTKFASKAVECTTLKLWQFYAKVSMYNEILVMIRSVFLKLLCSLIYYEDWPIVHVVPLKIHQLHIQNVNCVKYTEDLQYPNDQF